MEAEPTKAIPPKRKRRWNQFSLRTLMIAVTLFTVWLGLEWHSASGWKQQIGETVSTGTINGRDISSYIVNARAALDEWLKSKGYTPIDEGPDWFYQQYRGARARYYAGNAKGSTPLYVLVASWDNMLSARAGFRVFQRGPFDNARASENELHDLLSDLGDWWRDYRNIHGYP